MPLKYLHSLEVGSKVPTQNLHKWGTHLFPDEDVCYRRYLYENRVLENNIKFLKFLVLPTILFCKQGNTTDFLDMKFEKVLKV